MVDLDSAAEASDFDPHFEPTERLYRRIPLADVLSGFVDDPSLPSPAFSVDREKYRANPAEMLVGYPEMGVAVFYVRDIPSALISEDGRLFNFGVEHRPRNDNLAHSEVHSYQNGVRMDRKPPSIVRKKFRDLLRQKLVILKLDSKG